MKDNIVYKNNIFKKYISREQIIKKIDMMSKDLNRKYDNKSPIFVGVLKGSIYFMMDLLKKIDFDYEIDFIRIKSYSGMEQNKISVDS